MKTDISKILSAILIAATFLIFPNISFAAADMFLKIEGIDGESSDKDHKGEIDIISWSWDNKDSASRTEAPAEGTSGLLHVTIAHERMPPIIIACRKRGHVPSIKVRLSDSTQRYNLVKVWISNCDNISTAPSAQMNSTVMIRYDKIQYLGKPKKENKKPERKTSE
jgi:type VI secretion system secreted protein Hcp